MKENNPMKNPEVVKKVSEYRKTLVREKASNWKGGVRKAQGYITIYMPDHPRATRQRYVFEHHLVAEAKLGRYLLPKEVIHHINGVKDDNRIDNLMLFENNGEHLKFHIKLKKFSYLTNPMKREIESRKISNLNSESELKALQKQINSPEGIDFIKVNAKEFEYSRFKL